MDWNKANDYCKENGGQLPTPTGDDNRFLETVFDGIGSAKKIPLGFVNVNSKWLQIRGGEKNFSNITDVLPSLETLTLHKTASGFKRETALKKDEYTAVICEHRNSALSVIDKQECDDGFVLFAVSNASKCYLFHEFSNPSMDANDFNAVSSYCKSRNAELFQPADSGDLEIMQKIGEASGFAVTASAKHIYRQYGYINYKVKNAKEEPKTAVGYAFATVGMNVTNTASEGALCFMLELPGGSHFEKVEKIVDILGTEDVVITDLKQEITLKEIQDLSYLGVAPEAKRTVRVCAVSSVFYHVTMFVALFSIW